MRLEGKTVLVTGGNGFLGRHLVHALEQWHAYVISPRHDRFDLTDLGQTREMFRDCSFDYIFHLAGENGGLGKNLREPATIFYHNTLMALNLLEAYKDHAPQAKFIGVVASCAYGDCPEGVMKEQAFFQGQPHSSVIGHGLAKRNLQSACSLYHRQHGLRTVCVCPTTLYGPGDNFDLQRTKVVGALVRRFVDAYVNGDPEVVIPGTGSAYREFLYVKDAAQLILQAALKYDGSDYPLNLGSGQEFTIRELANLIRSLVGYAGKVVWDDSQPDGQRRKRLDLTEMNRLEIGLNTPTSLTDGILDTIEYYTRSQWLYQMEGSVGS